MRNRIGGIGLVESDWWNGIGGIGLVESDWWNFGGHGFCGNPKLDVCEHISPIAVICCLLIAADLRKILGRKGQYSQLTVSFAGFRDSAAP